MSRTIPFTQYLFKRLQQLNCYSIHGVPGDFFLRALDYTTPAGRAGTGPYWIGNASELCAGYAADGYARAATQFARHRNLPFAPTVGALFSTYGVGELSAINAVAGSFAESIPVVHMVGTPSRRAMAKGDPKRLIHHSFPDGNMERWADMAKSVTCAQAYLHRQEDSTIAADILDEVLEQAILRSKPVYVTIPSDLIDEEVPADRLWKKPLNLEPPPNDPEIVKMLLERLAEKIRSASSPLIIADSLSYPLQLHKEISSLAEMTGIRAMSYMSGKGIIEERLSSWEPALPNTTDESHDADFVMFFGPLLADTNTARWSAIPSSQDTVFFNLDTVEVNEQTCHVRSKALLEKLIKKLKGEHTETLIDSPDLENEEFDGEEIYDESHPVRPIRRADEKITQDDFWEVISECLQPYDTILLANGTPLIGARSLRLKDESTVIASSIWCSIGHMLPAAQGIAAAKADHGLGGRTILFEGDGSFQVTCQSISDILRNNLNVTIFLLNNKGYTYERWLNGMKADYNNVPNWRYLEAGHFFGGGDYDDPEMFRRVENLGQLYGLVEDYRRSDGWGLRIYEIVMDPEDVPEKSKAGLMKASEALQST